jgi:hypothetical protein
VAYELVVPVYRLEDPGASVASRRRLFVGWATGQFRAVVFLTDALRESLPTTGVELHDDEAGPASLVAAYPSMRYRATGPHVREKRFSFGGAGSPCATPPCPATPS